jgi:hypothetical protein
MLYITTIPSFLFFQMSSRPRTGAGAPPAAAAVPATAALTQAQSPSHDNQAEPTQTRLFNTPSLEENALLANHHSLHIDQITRNAVASLLKKQADLKNPRTSAGEKTTTTSNTVNGTAPVPVAMPLAPQPAAPPTANATPQPPRSAAQPPPAAPPLYQVATARLLNTLTLMNTKNGNITVDELDTVYSQFEAFMNAHPVHGAGKWQQLQRAMGGVKTMPPSTNPPETKPQRQTPAIPVPAASPRATVVPSLPPSKVPPRLPPRPALPPSQSLPVPQVHPNMQQKQIPASSAGVSVSAADSEAIARARAAVQREILQSQQKSSLSVPGIDNNIAARQLLQALSHQGSVYIINGYNTIGNSPSSATANTTFGLPRPADSTELAADALISLAEKSPLSPPLLANTNNTEGRNKRALRKRAINAPLPASGEENTRRLRQRTAEPQQTVYPTAVPAIITEAKAAPSVEEQLLRLLAYGMQNPAGQRQAAGVN